MHYYKILKHKAGFDEATNDWEKIFAHYVADTDKHVIFGALPLTFKADGGTINWTIYGKGPTTDTETGVLPLTFTTAQAGNAVDWVVSGNDNVGKNLLNLIGVDYSMFGNFVKSDEFGNIRITGTSNRSQNHTINLVRPNETVTDTDIFLTSGTYIMSGTISNTNNNYMLQIVSIVDGEAVASIGFDSGNGFNFTIAEPTYVRVRIYVKAEAYGNAVDLTFSPMVRKADTSSDFEPYQVGVGKRTANLYDKQHSNEENWYPLNNKITYSNATLSIIVPCEPSTQYAFLVTLCQRFRFVETDTEPERNLGYTAIRNFDNAENGVFVTGATTHYLMIYCYNSGISTTPTIEQIRNSLVLIKGSTAPTNYIPYGYEVPLTISQTGQTDKSYDIFIGDTPLTQGESISKTSTGVNIELFEGSNTVSTTLYNKPATSMEYTDYAGVGEKVNDQWCIPLTLNGTTTNVLIDAPLTEGHSVSGTMTAYEGTNTLDTTLEVKPDVTVTYEF